MFIVRGFHSTKHDSLENFFVTIETSFLLLKASVNLLSQEQIWFNSTLLIFFYVPRSAVLVVPAFRTTMVVGIEPLTIFLTSKEDDNLLFVLQWSLQCWVSCLYRTRQAEAADLGRGLQLWLLHFLTIFATCNSPDPRTRRRSNLISVVIDY